MIILDHNITRDQAEQLQQWRIHFRQIGFQIGRPEWDDQQEILRYLHKPIVRHSLPAISISTFLNCATKTIA